MNLENSFQLAADAILSADALLIGAGAGMGVDSGLPDFRGPRGFWKAYPPFRGRSFSDISTPELFETDPELAWGFFGHRLKLYQDTIPHRGFEILNRWSARFPKGAFVFTSNVDGHFQKAGFRDDQIVECHGSINFLQCAGPCGREIWPSSGLSVDVDLATIKATTPLPVCPDCGGLARPNILMFDDWDWIADRTEKQTELWMRWQNRAASQRMVTIELGAGLGVPTVRRTCDRQPGLQIRINPIDAKVAPPGISLPVGALEALTTIDQLIRMRQSTDQ